MPTQQQLSPHVQTDSDGLTLGYQTVRSSKFTFEAEKIRTWVGNQIPAGARVLNACAGLWEIPHNGPTIRNDIRTTVTLERDRTINGTEYTAGDTVSTRIDLNADVATLADQGHLEPNSVDYIVFDPPFSATQSDHAYDTGARTLYHPDVIDQLRTILRPDGTLMCWSYSPRLYDGFEIDQLMLWNRVGRGFDYVTTSLTKSGEASVAPISHQQPAAFNPVIAGVTGDASFGGNNGKPVEMSLHAAPDVAPSAQTLRLIGEHVDGLTLIITDTDRDYSRIKTDKTGIVSLVDATDSDSSATRLNDHADDWIGVNDLSTALPTDTFDTVILDLQSEAFSWNTYYEGPNTPWKEATTQTGYETALKHEARQLTKPTPGATIVQVGQTATNMSGDDPFIRSHITLTGLVNSAAVTAPLIVVDKRIAAPANDNSSSASDSEHLFFPTRQRTGERPPSEFRYSNGFESTYLRPAYQYHCPTCHAAPGNCCLSDAGNPVPTGTVHNARAEHELDFYEDPVYTLEAYLRGPHGSFQRYIRKQFAATDPARPQTRGGRGQRPPATDQPTSACDPQLRLTSFDG